MTQDGFFEAIESKDTDKAIECFRFYIDHFPITVKERILMSSGAFIETSRRRSMRISHFDNTGSHKAQVFTMEKLFNIKDKLKDYYTKNYKS